MSTATGSPACRDDEVDPVSTRIDDALPHHTRERKKIKYNRLHTIPESERDRPYAAVGLVSDEQLLLQRRSSTHILSMIFVRPRRKASPPPPLPHI